MENCNPLVLDRFTKISLKLTPFEYFSINTQLSYYLDNKYLLLFDEEGIYFMRDGNKEILPTVLIQEIIKYINSIEYNEFILFKVTDMWELSIIDYIANMLSLKIKNSNILSMKIESKYEKSYMDIYQNKLDEIIKLYDVLKKNGTYLLPSLEIAKLWKFDILYNDPLIGQINKKAWQCFQHYNYDFMIRIFTGKTIKLELLNNDVIYKHHISYNLKNHSINHYFFEKYIFVNVLSLSQLKKVHNILISETTENMLSNVNYVNMETYISSNVVGEKIMYRDVSDNQSYVVIF